MSLYRVVFLTGPPNFQYQNEKTCSANEALFYIENFVKTSPGWLQLVFHFGTEDRADQLKETPCIRLKGVGLGSQMP